MADLRAYVCYAQESVEDDLFVQRLVDDLCQAGIDAISGGDWQRDAMEEHVLAKLQESQWVILVQTPAAVRSPHVRFTVDAALDLVQQQRLHGVLAVIAELDLAQNIPANWTALETFDASEDYPKALARLLLALNPGLSATMASVQMRAAPAPAFQLRAAAPVVMPAMEADDEPARFMPLWLRERQLKLWLVPLSVALALVIVSTSAVALYAFSRPSRPQGRGVTAHATVTRPVPTTGRQTAISPTKASVVPTPTAVPASSAPIVITVVVTPNATPASSTQTVVALAPTPTPVPVPTSTPVPAPAPAPAPKPKPVPTPTPVPAAPVCPPTIASGSTGTWVRTLQIDLNTNYNRHSFANAPFNFSPPLMTDGIFGPMTTVATKDFQSAKRLGVDGIVGPMTWHALGYC